jgi:hypothetical protein
MGGLKSIRSKAASGYPDRLTHAKLHASDTRSRAQKSRLQRTIHRPPARRRYETDP